VLEIPARVRGYQTESFAEPVQRGKRKSPDIVPAYRDASKSDIEGARHSSYGLRSRGASKSPQLHENPRLNIKDTPQQASIRAKSYEWLDKLHAKMANQNPIEKLDPTIFELGNFLGDDSVSSRTFTLDKITLKRTFLNKTLKLIDSWGFNLHDNKEVPWKEVYIRNIKIECSSLSKGLEIKNIYLEVDDVLKYEDFVVKM